MFDIKGQTVLEKLFKFTYPTLRSPGKGVITWSFVFLLPWKCDPGMIEAMSVLICSKSQAQSLGNKKNLINIFD